MSWLSHKSSDMVSLEMGLLLSVQGSLQALGALALPAASLAHLQSQDVAVPQHFSVQANLQG